MVSVDRPAFCCGTPQTLVIVLQHRAPAAAIHTFDQFKLRWNNDATMPLIQCKNNIGCHGYERVEC